uniref:Myb/SANT-like domain-containing protein n=1 Tax=Aegilops tauschii TaxID=37682 RepID=M8CUY8_AEGTA
MTAEWDEENTRIVTNLMVTQVRAGNRPNKILTPSAFEEVALQFKVRTGLDYTSNQMKNKWDKLKADYALFKKLKLKETGGGWDFVLNTIKQDKEWWKKAKIDLKGCGKFQKRGLRNEENLSIMFEDITSDGSNHWNPSTGIPPSSSAAIPDTIDIEAITDVDLLEDPQVPPSPAMPPSPFVPSTKKRLGKTIDDKHKKPRTAQVMQDEITQIKIIAKESQETVQSFIKNDDATSVASTMNEVLALGILEGATKIVGKYCSSWIMKNEPKKSILTGFGWLQETIGTPGETFTMFRMKTRVFFELHDLLVKDYGLGYSPFVSSYESLAMFLWTLGGCESNRRTQNRFKHSPDTIHRKFHEVLHCVVRMSCHYLKPKDPNFHIVHQRILGDKRAYPHMKDCIGAIDGTHIRASIPEDKQIRYIGRTVAVTQNVMAICDFDMHFTYASIGQPGSMHDTSVLFHAMHADKATFPHPPKDKYYLVDAGYPNRKGHLAPSQEDIHFVRCDKDPDYVPTIPERYKKFVVPSHASDTSTTAENGEDMDVFRQELATAIALSW